VHHSDGRAILADELRGLIGYRGNLTGYEFIEKPPYVELEQSGANEICKVQKQVVFITGRFRSGSTLLWNVFRHVEGCTAYYEPFNERRWFDAAARGPLVDTSHRGVSDYWREYEGLKILGQFYDEDWTRRDLLMDERSWNPQMKRFLVLLVEQAAGRPVLKFNRLDFRLPWVRRYFPSAKIVHIYRHPRDQWCSTFLRKSPFPPTAGMGGYDQHDEFYLLTWARDLRLHFPFLDEREVEHPYQIFYYLWKLSYLFGKMFSDISVRFEDLIADPSRELAILFGAIDMAPSNMKQLCDLCEKPRVGRWSEYANNEWFVHHELRCESVLAEFLGYDHIAKINSQRLEVGA
jgi:Sulfotransferase family